MTSHDLTQPGTLQLLPETVVPASIPNPDMSDCCEVKSVSGCGLRPFHRETERKLIT